MDERKNLKNKSPVKTKKKTVKTQKNRQKNILVESKKKNYK